MDLVQKDPEMEPSAFALQKQKQQNAKASAFAFQKQMAKQSN